MRQGLVGAIASMAIAATGPSALAASPPATWENLVKVPSKTVAAVYLQPGEDFCLYTPACTAHGDPKT